MEGREGEYYCIVAGVILFALLSFILSCPLCLF